MRIILSFLLASTLSAFAQNIPLQNWPVAATRTNALAFVAVTPCRLVDTRNPSGPFGGPSYAALETRTYDVAAGPCTGLPLTAQSYSLNFTIVNYNVASGSYITAWAAGTTRPNVSSVNFGTGVPVANASIVATGASGQISVFAGGATDIIIDLNGYFIGGAGTLPAGKSFRMTGSMDDSGVIYGINGSSVSGIYTTGVLGTLTTLNLTDGSGVMGYTTAGATWGVKGFNSGTTGFGGGVLGISGARSGTAIGNLAGVRGESQLGFGVLGNTNNAAGVGGTYNDANGNILRSGYLANNTYAVYAAGDLAASGTKFFVDPHPSDATKVIRFAALEGPEAGTYFRGRGRFVHGRAVIDVPEAFRMTTEEEGMTVHLTPIGGLAMVAVTQQSLDHIEAEASKDVEFSYVVYGVRRGYKDFQPIRDGVEFIPDSPTAKLPAYLNEEQKKRLIDNGTYNSDGTVNLGTAVKLGWDKAWREQR
ncbi:MAG: hypothetical protein JO197_16130 [Acidobacteria bacterium]|nr:hypothetical protein [Acidobacteriota bacterium]MBV9475694.1 hypothetical protein [Acidobacteriota bacterium]